jgi:hypothetical protein
VAGFHSRTVPSPPALASSLPSGLNATPNTPPLGSLLGAPLYVDQEVLQHETVVFAAGSQTESVQIKTADLLQHEQVTTLPLIKHADENGKDWRR